MRRFFAIIVVIIITVSLQGCATSQDNVNEIDGVVLTSDETQCSETSQVNVNEIDGVVLTLDEEQCWEPDKNIINEFEQGLVSYVNNFKDSEGDEIYCNEESLEFVKKNINKYKRQYIGKIIDGREILFCNFLLIDEIDDALGNWKTTYITVRDGGPNFFQINYDVENKNFFGFSINGYA